MVHMEQSPHFDESGASPPNALLVSVAWAAERLGKSKASIYDYASRSSGGLTPIRFGGAIMLRRSEVEHVARHGLPYLAPRPRKGRR
jgi:hypothetical protein